MSEELRPDLSNKIMNFDEIGAAIIAPLDERIGEDAERNVAWTATAASLLTFALSSR